MNRYIFSNNTDSGKCVPARAGSVNRARRYGKRRAKDVASREMKMKLSFFKALKRGELEPSTTQEGQVKTARRVANDGPQIPMVAKAESSEFLAPTGQVLLYLQTCNYRIIVVPFWQTKNRKNKDKEQCLRRHMTWLCLSPMAVTGRRRER